MRPDVDIAACRAAHAALLHAIAPLTDADVGAPSLLSDWTRGHVITHLARNADSHVRLFEAATRGDVGCQYATSDARAADIEAGASRDAATLYADVARACAELEAAWDSFPDEMWDRTAVVTPGERTLRELVFRRLREVEVHHVDLDVGRTPQQWSSAYVEGELARRLANLADRADHIALVCWLIGRSDAPELAPW